MLEGQGLERRRVGRAHFHGHAANDRVAFRTGGEPVGAGQFRCESEDAFCIGRGFDDAWRITVAVIAGQDFNFDSAGGLAVHQELEADRLAGEDIVRMGDGLELEPLALGRKDFSGRRT